MRYDATVALMSAVWTATFVRSSFLPTAITISPVNDPLRPIRGVGARGAGSAVTGVHAADMKVTRTLEAEREPRNFKDARRSRRLRAQLCPLHGHRVARASQEDGGTDRESCE